MVVIDMPLKELETLELPLTREADFDAFWSARLSESAAQPLDPESTPVSYGVPDLKVDKVSYSAFDGGRIVGWSITPAAIKPRPTLIFFNGYGGNKVKVANYLMWALQGFTCLTFDVRGQSGESSDFAQYPGGHTAGWVTWGLLDPKRYYFTRAYVDMVRAIDFAVTRPEVDADRIGTTGCSQGGGLSLAAAALDDRSKLCMAEVPGFGHFHRTLDVTKAPPWTDLTGYFQMRPQDIEQGMRTLSYVELNNMADRIQCPTLISVGMQDDICLPSTIFTVYNRIPAQEKLIEVFPYNGHEGALNVETMIVWARKYLMEA